MHRLWQLSQWQTATMATSLASLFVFLLPVHQLKSFPMGEGCVEPISNDSYRVVFLFLRVHCNCNSIWRACISEELGGGGEGRAGEVTGSLLSKYERERRRRRSPWAGYNRKSLSPPPLPPIRMLWVRVMSTSQCAHSAFPHLDLL